MISAPQGRLEQAPTAGPSPPAWAATCLNCGTALSGPFCSACGQRAVPPRPSLRDLLHDALHELAHWDGKIAETLRCLIGRPGALTCNVLEGRRARYISPLRLYLTCSVIYFVLAAASPARVVSISLAPRLPRSGVQVKTPGTGAGLTEEDRRLILAGLDELPPVLRPLMRRAVEDPRGLVRDVFNAWPKALFVLLPVFAGILALFYRQRPFVEHLYFALHLHAFAFLVMFAAALAAFTHAAWLGAAVGVVVLVWIPVYAHLAFRRVYGDTHLVTMLKETGVSVLYSIATVPAIFAVALWVASHPH